jgi:hypothetical protein
VVAEGTYGVRDPELQNQAVPMPGWKMIANDDGTFDLTVFQTGLSNLKDSLRTEYHLSPELHLLSYAVYTDGADVSSARSEFKCSIGADLGCEFKAPSVPVQSSRIDVSQPYLIVASELFPGDVLWEIGLLLRDFRKVGGEPFKIAVIGIDDDDTRFSIKRVDTERFTYVGTEEFSSNVGIVKTHVFRSNDSTYWVASSGLLIAYQTNSSNSSRFELLSLQGPFRDKLLATR